MHRCRLREGQTGLCRARANHGGVSVPINYGRITSLALDPIEKKPLAFFHPGSHVLSVGSFGCNLNCPFCQNDEISMASEETAVSRFLSPGELLERALRLVPRGNIGAAFTYNEPMVGWEYVRDCSRLLKERGLVSVVVTNGSVLLPVLREVLPVVDAFNIDLKGFTERYYRWLGGDLKTVKEFIAEAAGRAHVELTTLIVPGENDDPEEMDALARWVAGVDPEIPLHITRFFPARKLTDRGATPVQTILDLKRVAERHLTRVLTGNM